MPTYSLLTEPWIPVLDAGTDLRETPDAPAVLREVGLREALLRAHEIREVYTDSPLETIALNRLLLALALDVYQRTPDADVWVGLWRAGLLPDGRLDAYLGHPDEGLGRFDLLDPERPFFQTSKPAARDASLSSRLFHQIASGNNGTLFDHTIDSDPVESSLNEAARGLVASQAFGLSGLAGSSAKGGRLPNFSQGPLVGKAQFWVRGRSLFDALLLNGPPDKEARMGATEKDAPVWRRATSDVPRSRRHEGLLDALTWTSRHVSLMSRESGGSVTISGAFLSPADSLNPQPTNDPLTAYLKSKEAGIYPLGFRAGRALWRDASAMYATTNAAGQGAPRTFKWVASAAESVLRDEMPALRRAFRERGVDVFGLVTKPGKAGSVDLWRHERMPLHVAILRDHTRQTLVDLALKAAADRLVDAETGLNPALRTTAAYALAPPPPGSVSRPKADPTAVKNLCKSLAAEPRYWAALELPFLTFLARLADAEDAPARDAALATWLDDIRTAAMHAFDTATASFDGDARHLRATAEGRARLQTAAPPRAEPPAPPLPAPSPLSLFPL